MGRKQRRKHAWGRIFEGLQRRKREEPMTQGLIAHLNAILSRYSVTQRDISAQIGITEATLSRILNGQQVPINVTKRAIEHWLDEHNDEYPLRRGL